MTSISSHSSRSAASKPVRRATLAQVAAKSGCSVSTVSAVLSNRFDCWASQQTRQRVQATARALNYRPNLAARSLRGGASQTLGLVTTALNILVTLQKMQAFEAAARRAGYVTMITFSPNEPDTESRVIAALLDRNIDGLAVYPAEEGPHGELGKLVQRGFPIVTIDGAGRLDFPCDDVSMDYRAVGRMQARHLLDLGRSRLCQINSFPNCYAKDQLRRGAQDVCAEHGVELLLCDLQVPATEGDVVGDAMVEQMRDFLEQHLDQVDALMGNDVLAAVGLRAALSLGLRVPEDLAIIGADDSPTARNNAIPLSSVAQPAEKIALWSLALLKRRLRNSAAPFRSVLTRPQLIPRFSTMGTSSIPANVSRSGL